jgi:hypothetical protein
VRDSRGLLVVIAVVVVLAAVVWLVSRPEHVPERLIPEDNAPVRFRFVDVAVTSPDLQVVAPEIRGAFRSTYSSWLIVLTCAEPDGCAGEFALEVSYDSGGESRKLAIVEQCDVANGGELRFEGLQDPSTPIDRVERLTLTVLDRKVPGQSGNVVEF